METNCFYSIPRNLDSWINLYNQTPLGWNKSVSLERIQKIVGRNLRENKSAELAQEIRQKLKLVRFHQNHIALWSRFIEFFFPTLSVGTLEDLPDELYELIFRFIEKADVQSLAQIKNKRVQRVLNSQAFIFHFLDKFSSRIFFFKRLELALLSGERLTRLNLSVGYYQEFDCQLLQSYPNLKSLDLSGLRIKGLNFLSEGLIELNFKYCKFSEDEAFAKLTTLQKLKKLNLGSTYVETLTIFSNSLLELDLSGCGCLKPEEFAKLKNLRLERLNLSNTRINRLDILPNCVKELNLDCCKGIKPEEFANLSALLQLINLNLKSTRITKVYSFFNRLRKLNLSHCTDIAPEEIAKISTLLELKEIKVKGVIEKLNKHFMNRRLLMKIEPFFRKTR